MNLIVFVVTILMLVGVLTYARVETYRNLSILQSQFDQYMDKTERKTLNKANKKRYDDTVATKKEKAKDDKEKKIPADRKISFRLFVNEMERQTEMNQLSQYILLAKNLMQHVYGEQKFFKEALQEKPDLLNDLMQGIINASVSLSPDQKLKEAKEMANLDLKDPLLNSVFYKMLRGTDEGYPSLLDYISLDNKKQIRIYLASPPVLMAIFGDPTTVKGIMITREELYKRLDKDKSLKPEELTKEFEQFRNRALPGINQALLNFQVSKTDPKNYR